MESEFVEIICQIGIFMICAQVIVHFRPEASYEKYLKMLVSSMILIQLLLSVGGIFSLGGERSLEERTEAFVQSLEESMRQASKNSFLAEDVQVQITGERPGNPEEKEETEDVLRGITVQVDPISPIRIEGGTDTD